MTKWLYLSIFKEHQHSVPRHLQKTGYFIPRNSGCIVGSNLNFEKTSHKINKILQHFRLCRFINWCSRHLSLGVWSKEATRRRGLIKRELIVQKVSFVVVWWLSLLHNFIQLSLNSGSAQVQTLLAACRRFAMVRISDNGAAGNKAKHLLSINHTTKTIHHHQFTKTMYDEVF